MTILAEFVDMPIGCVFGVLDGSADDAIYLGLLFNSQGA